MKIPGSTDKEARTTRLQIALEFDAASNRVPVVVPEPVVEVGRNFKVDVVIRHTRKRGETD